MPLTGIYVGTFLLVALVHWGAKQVFALSDQLGQQALIVAAIGAFGGVLSHILPNNCKYSLVYWRLRNVLSGHRRRSNCEKDPRVLSGDVQRKWPALFLDEMGEYEQNAYWYKEFYRPVRNEPEVSQSHRCFLLFRDDAIGLLVLPLGLLLWKAVGEAFPVESVSMWSVGILAAIFVLVPVAARQSGDRMVANAVTVALQSNDGSEEGRMTKTLMTDATEGTVTVHVNNRQG